MKALLFSIGTRGDIEPFLAIAQVLKEKDWDVVCIFPEQFRETVEKMGLPFHGFDKKFLEILDGKEAKMFMGGQGSIFKRILFLIRMAWLGIKLSKGILAQHHKIQKEENPDRVLYHPKCNYSLIWGMANPGKSILVSPVPGICHPVNHMTILGDYGKVLNRFNFWVQNMAKSLMLRIFSKRYREDYPDLKITVSSIKKAMLKKEKSLYAVSPSLFPKPEYWPPSAHVVGYYERDKTMDWEPDEALIAFLKRNEKVVFITFGSMSNAKPEQTTRAIVDVLERNDVAAIINTSWGGLQQTEKSSDNIHFVDNLPYEWLFPKIDAVVHHGGSGTTHTALKYGCPSLIIPHILDQFYWNETISTLELGPKGMSIKNFMEGNFEEKLLELLNNNSYKRNAALMAEKMKNEANAEKLFKMITV